MILFNGCSFTLGVKKGSSKSQTFISNTYANFLGDALDKPTYNTSHSGKDNVTMISDIITILMWEEREKLGEEKIDIIVLQPSDFFRCYIPSPDFNQYHQINNLKRQLLFHNNKYVKLMIHNVFMRHMKECGNAKEAFWVGAFLPDRAVYYTCTAGDTSETFMKYQWCQKLMHLQLLCEIKKIKLVIMNYYPIGEDYKKDPLFQAINLDNFIIEDPFKSGMYEHLEQEAFTKTEDDFHWEIDAHKYQADILEDFIKNNTKIKVKSNIESHTTEIYDYTI